VGVANELSELLAGRSGGARRRGGRSPRVQEIALVVALFAAVTVLRWYVDGAGEAAALLYVVPIVLSARRFGRRAGIGVAALSAAAFVVLTAVHGRGDLDLTGWVGPLLVMATVAAFGAPSARPADVDRTVSDAVGQRDYLQNVCAVQHSALVASDSMIQEVASARWMLELGHTDEAIEVLGTTLARGISRVSAALAFEPSVRDDAVGGGAPGRTVDGPPAGDRG